MRIKKIHIDSFMGTVDKDLEFTHGINILRGDNESGKSTVAEFIKFMLYGASARGTEGEISERQRYLSFGESSFGGYMELHCQKGDFRIDRTVNQTQSGFRESLSITDLVKKTQVFRGENPGEALLEIPESVFEKVAYISQEHEAYTGGKELGSAIENLLFAGDETVSTDKALKKIDALRVSLLYKNEKGGMLFEIGRERESLEARLQKALAENSEIIAKEGSLADTLRLIEENKGEYNRCKKLCELYDNYIAYTRFKKLDELKAEKEEREKEAKGLDESFEGFIPDGEYLGRLRQIAEQIADGERSAAAAAAKHENSVRATAAAEEMLTDGGDTTSLTEAAERLAKVKGAAKLLLFFGIGLFVLAAAAFAITYLMRLETVFFAGGAVALATGVLLFVLSLGKHKRLKAMLSSYGVAGEYELLEKAKEMADEGARSKDALARAREKQLAAEALYKNEESRLSALRASFCTEASKMGKGEEQAEAVFAKAESFISKREELISGIKVLAKHIAELERESKAYNREAVEKLLKAVGDLSIFEKVDITEYTRKRSFCENTLSALEIKKNNLEKELAALHATVENPALIKATLDELCKKEKNTKAKYNAATLALAAIQKASSGLRTRVSPRLAEYAGKLMAVMTDGKYSEIGVDGEISMSFVSKGGAHEAEYLSKGTRESAYFALRLALCDLVAKEEKLTLVLDESFAHADDKRTKQMLKILFALAAEDTQSIILTCHNREEKLADSIGVYNLIEM